MDIHCNYGILHDCSGVEYFSDHSVKGCIVNKRSELVIQGKTIPLQYDHEGVRRKYIPSVYFYPGGAAVSYCIAGTYHVFHTAPRYTC